MNRSLLALTVTLLLLAATPLVHAWHWDDENEDRRYGSQAGDARVLEDAAACFQADGVANGSTCAALYLHLHDLDDAGKMNAVRPADCLSETASGVQGLDPAPPRRVFALDPTPVDHGGTDDPCPGAPRLHPERDRYDDVRLSREVPITAHWFLSADLAGGAVEGAAFGAVPCLTVHVTLQTGRFVGSGDVVASGETTKTLLSPPPGTGGTPVPVADPCPGATGTIESGDVTEFVVDLGTAQRDVRSDEELLAVVRWEQWDGANPTEQTTTQPHWKIHSDAEHVNRIVLGVQGALRIEGLELQEHDGQHYLRARIVSPLGPYDLDVANLRLVLADEDGTAVPLAHVEEPVLHYSVSAESVYDPVRLTFPWSLAAEALAPGTYTLTLQAANWQHTAVAAASVPVEVSERDGRAAPGAPAFAVFLCAAFLLRRLTSRNA